jgi:hypothetical protein
MNILRPFVTELTEDEKLCGFFEQESVTHYKAYAHTEAQPEVFDGHIISCVLWSPLPSFNTS